MDKTEKMVFITAASVLAIFFLAILAAERWLSAGVPECLPKGEVYTEGKVEQLDDNTFQLFYVAEMWRFQPEVVTLPVGAEVDIYLTAKDVVHGMDINFTHVNMMAVPGNVNKMSYTFNNPGVYKIKCHEYCGAGHHDMDAQIIVKER